MHVNGIENGLKHAQRVADKLAKRKVEGRSMPKIYAGDLPSNVASRIGARFSKIA